jgi:hypothetical protein
VYPDQLTRAPAHPGQATPAVAVQGSSGQEAMPYGVFGPRQAAAARSSPGNPAQDAAYPQRRAPARPDQDASGTGRSRRHSGQAHDLLTAAVAGPERLTILRYESSQELIAQVTGQPAHRGVPRGTAPLGIARHGPARAGGQCAAAERVSAETSGAIARDIAETRSSWPVQNAAARRALPAAGTGSGPGRQGKGQRAAIGARSVAAWPR